VIKEVEETSEEKAGVKEEAKWLMSVPGIGFHNALLILSELGEIERFKRPESLVCYAGLAPKVEQSGEHVRYGLWGSAPRPRKPCKGLTMCRGRHEEMNVGHKRLNINEGGK